MRKLRLSDAEPSQAHQTFKWRSWDLSPDFSASRACEYSFLSSKSAVLSSKDSVSLIIYVPLISRM